MQANVILCKCDHKHTFGIRVEKRGGDWVRTWAFKIDEDKAKNEGYDRVEINGSFDPVDGYPGCPYCGEIGLVCCSCGKWNCASSLSEPDRHGNEQFTCNWCGETGSVESVDIITGQGGGR